MKKLFAMTIIVLSLVCIFTSCDMLPLPFPQEKEDEITVEDGYLVVNGVKTEYEIDDGSDTPDDNACTHAQREENRIEATCEKAGSYDIVTYCTKCGIEFNRTTVTLEQLPHTESDWIVDKAATCTEAGLRYKECTECGTVLTQEDIAATGIHDYGTDGKCTVCGAQDPNANPGYSAGLEYTSNGDGTCYVSGIGTCTDTDVVIPEISPEGWRVTGIGESAFSRNAVITSIVLPDSIVKINDYAFDYCENLKYNQYDNAYYIGSKSNPYLVLIKSIDKSIEFCVINENTKIIYDCAFRDCINLTSIVIPDGVVKIGNHTFQSCSSLIYAVIPNSINEFIGWFAFYDLDDEFIVYFKGAKNEWQNIRMHMPGNELLSDSPRYYYSETEPTKEGNFWHYVDGVPTVWDAYVEPEASDELAYTLSNDGTYYIVTGIGTYKESELIIPSEYKGLPVKEIAKNAFDNCDTITSATIPDSVIIINDCAFRYCRNLKDVYIGAGVKNIGYWAFGFCSNIKAVHIKDLIAWCNISFYGQASNPLEANNDTQGMGSDLYLNGELVRNLVIPEEATVIEKYAFSNCLSITSITITNATSIGDYAFWHCSNLTNIDISDSVISIGQGAFEYCYNLTCVVIPDSVTSIGTTAFGWCTNLASVVIPDNVTSIGASAFYNCKSLTDIYYTGTEEDWAKIEIDNSYGYNNYLLNATIHYSYIPEE